MELVGPNLMDLFRECGGRFSNKTCFMLAIQLLTILNDFNRKGYVHRDIKPHHLCMGYGNKSDRLMVVDYSTARLINDLELILIPQLPTKKLLLDEDHLGDPIFCSKYI